VTIQSWHNARKLLFAFTLLTLWTTALVARAEGPLASHVDVQVLQSYAGGQSLPKPEKIVVYDFTVDPENVTLDKSKVDEIRPSSHLRNREHDPAKLGQKVADKLASELAKDLGKTGLPVERAAAGSNPPDNALVVTGSFTSIAEGSTTEREGIGMGAGSAEVSTQVRVALNNQGKNTMLSEFTTETSKSKNVGAAVPVAAGLNPAVAGARAVTSDRKKNVTADASKTADATAKQISGVMSELGWIPSDTKQGAATSK